MNIYDLAREAGVSIATASKALNGRSDVNEQTRAKVLEMAKRLHYHPSHLARGLARRRTENIGVLALRRGDGPFFGRSFYARVIEGMEREVASRNYNLFLAILPSGPAEASVQLPKLVLEKNTDGLVLLGEMPAELLREVFDRRIPSVIVNFHGPQLPAHCVFVDNRGAEHGLVGHLAELGHREFVFVRRGGDDFNVSERQAGFEDACTVHKVQGTVWTLPDGGWPQVEDEIRRVLQDPEGFRATAVLADDDEHALAVLRVAREIGLHVPRDLSVAGFGDGEAAEQAGLSTLRVDREGMGLCAARGVFRLMDAPLDTAGFEQVQVELVVRGSTGPAAR